MSDKCLLELLLNLSTPLLKRNICFCLQNVRLRTENVTVKFYAFNSCYYFQPMLINYFISRYITMDEPSKGIKYGCLFNF
jgi:hypothetical protein